MSSSADFTLKLSIGESLFQPVTWRQAGQPVDLTSTSLVMEIRQNINSDVILTASTDNGRIVIDADPTTGRFEIRIGATDIATDLGEEGNFCYRIDALGSGDMRTRLFGGQLKIKRE